MEELSLFKLNQKIELIDCQQYFTIRASSWVNNKVSVSMNLNSYSVAQSGYAVKGIVGPRYYDEDSPNNYPNIDKLTEAKITAKISNINGSKFVIITLYANGTVPDFDFDIDVQLTALLGENNISSCISAFPTANAPLPVVDEKVKINITTSDSKNRLAFVPNSVQSGDTTTLTTYNVNYNTNTEPFDVYVNPRHNKIYATMLNNSNIISHAFFNNNTGRSAHFDNAGHIFEIGIRKPTEYNAYNYTTITDHEDWATKITFRNGVVPLTGQGSKTQTQDNTQITLHSDVVKFKKGLTQNITNTNTITTKTLRIPMNGNIHYKGKDLLDVIAQIARSNTCIIGYDNAPYSQYFTYKLDSTLSTPELRAQNFVDVLNQAMEKCVGESDTHMYNEIVLVPGYYYLTGQVLEIARGNFTIRGINQSTIIYCDENTLINNHKLKDENNVPLYRGVLNILGGNVNIENLTLGYYIAYTRAKNITDDPNAFGLDATEKYAIYGSMVGVFATGFQAKDLNFTHIVVGQAGTTKDNVNQNGQGFTYTEENGLAINRAEDTYDVNAHGYGNTLAWMLAYAIEVRCDDNHFYNLGVYNCVFSDTYTKYTVWRTRVGSCVSIMNGCRCVRQKVLYACNMPIAACVARDSVLKSTNNNISGDVFKVDGVFPSVNYTD